jgi:hypothetical protein
MENGECQAKPVEKWAIVEIMGHRRLAGRISEASFAGAQFVRVEAPTFSDGFTSPQQEVMVEQLYAPGSIFAITPCDEATARRYAKAWSYQVAGYLPQVGASEDGGQRPEEADEDEETYLGGFG